jgi:hypothetical protein
MQNEVSKYLVSYDRLESDILASWQVNENWPAAGRMEKERPVRGNDG